MTELEQEIFNLVQAGVRTRKQMSRVIDASQYKIRRALVDMVKNHKLSMIKRRTEKAPECFYYEGKEVVKNKTNYNLTLTKKWV